MIKVFFLIFSCILLSSCYSFFYNAEKIKVDSSNKYNYQYYINIKSWIGRPIEELIHSWGTPLAIFTNEHKITNPFNVAKLENDQKVYLWFDYGDISQTEAEIEACSRTQLGSRAGCETKEVHCRTSALVDKNGYIEDIKPNSYNISDCIDGITYRMLYFPKAPE